jgi:hypothetical protein
MKIYLSLLFILITSFAFSQTKYGWVPTGNVQRWKSDIYLDSTVNKDMVKIDGYVYYIQEKYVPAPGEIGWNIVRPKIWVKDPSGIAYDAAMKVIKYKISYVQSKEPASLKIHRQ